MKFFFVVTVKTFKRLLVAWQVTLFLYIQYYIGARIETLRGPVVSPNDISVYHFVVPI
jgi:hypothetical protein